MSIKERIYQLIDYKHLSVLAFEKSTGLSNGYIRNTANISAKNCAKILSTFPDVSAEWLINGNGGMLKDDNNAKEIGRVWAAEERDDEVIMVDIIPIAAQATFTESFADAAAWEDKMPIVPIGDERLDADSLKIFEIEGDSMYPTLVSGAYILAKEIPQSSWHYAEGVVVAVFNEFVVVKRVASNNLLQFNSPCITLSSDNERYGSMTVALADLRALYKAKRIISSPIM